METIASSIVQTTFPSHDLLAANAEKIGLIFGNSRIVEMQHRKAELQYPVFQDTHAALIEAEKEYFTFYGPTEAVYHGIILYEALHAFVSSEAQIKKMFVTSNIVKLLKWENDQTIRDYLLSAEEEFKAEMPHTTDAFIEASERFFPGTLNGVIIGAGWARKIHTARIPN